MPDLIDRIDATDLEVNEVNPVNEVLPAAHLSRQPGDVSLTIPEPG